MLPLLRCRKLDFAQHEARERPTRLGLLAVERRLLKRECGLTAWRGLPAASSRQWFRAGWPFGGDQASPTVEPECWLWKKNQWTRGRSWRRQLEFRSNPVSVGGGTGSTTHERLVQPAHEWGWRLGALTAHGGGARSTVKLRRRWRLASLWPYRAVGAFESGLRA